jgi:hypothetical protein
MNLDIRFPIGLLFALFGVVLVIFGLVSDPAIYQRSLGINVNLWWGLVQLVFGAIFLFFAWRAKKRSAP